MRPKRRGGSEIEMLSATVRSGISDSSWKTQTMPALAASEGVVKRCGAPSTASVPVSAATTPAMILIRVDLPAPFSPRMAWIEPRRQEKSTPSRAPHAGEELGYAGQFGEGPASCRIRLPPSFTRPSNQLGPQSRVGMRTRAAPIEPAPPRGAAVYCTSASVCAMMAGPVMFTPQGGNSFTVKKLSGRSVQ